MSLNIELELVNSNDQSKVRRFVCVDSGLHVPQSIILVIWRCMAQEEMNAVKDYNKLQYVASVGSG